MKVVVVGAGLAGLATAVGLLQDGHQVTLLDQAEQISQAGAGIGVMPNGLRALDRIGLGDAVRAHHVAGEGDGTTRDRGGRILIGSSTETQSSKSLDMVVALPRKALAAILMEALPGGSIQQPIKVTDVEPNTGTVTTASGAFGADLVIAADGAGSRTRRILFPGHAGLRPSGQHAAQAIVPSFAQDVSPIIGEMLDYRSGGRFGTLPMADGSIYWYSLWKSDRATPTDNAELLRWLRRSRTDWHPLVGDLLSATDPETMHARETASLASSLKSLYLGRVALLGDAAHAMTPDLGQGASQAFEDAIALIEAVRAHGNNIPAVMRQYDSARRVSTARMIRLSRVTGQLSSLQGAPGMVRDAIMRLVSPKTT